MINQDFFLALEELEKQNGIYANMVKTQLKVTDWSL